MWGRLSHPVIAAELWLNICTTWEKDTLPQQKDYRGAKGNRKQKGTRKQNSGERERVKDTEYI